MVERRDHVGLVERPRLVDRRLPELQRPVRTGARTSGREQRAPGEERFVPVEQLDAEGVVDRAVVVEAAVQALDLLGRDEVQEVLVEVRAHDDPTSLLEAGTVQLVEERRQTRRHDRVEHDVGLRRHDVGDDPAS